MLSPIPRSKKTLAPPKPAPLPVTCMVLAGGKCSRMGKDKARLRLEGRTFIQWIRNTVSALDLPFRVIRQDLIVSCGPLAGIVTGLTRARTDWVMFLACDMPLVRLDVLRRILETGLNDKVAAAAAVRRRSGFPMLLPRQCLNVVRDQIAAGNLRLDSLLRRLRAERVVVRGADALSLVNINTPQDLERARRLIAAT